MLLGGEIEKEETYPNEAPGLCDWPWSAPDPCALPGCAHPRCPGSIAVDRKRCFFQRSRRL